MSADGSTIAPDSAADGPKVRLLTLSDLDGRTGAAKAARAMIADLESDLGGADRLSAGERAIVGRAAVTGAMIENLEATWLTGRPIDFGEYASLVNLQRRLLTTVGLERRSRDVTPALADYVAAQTVDAPVGPGGAAPRAVTPPPPVQPK